MTHKPSTVSRYQAVVPSESQQALFARTALFSALSATLVGFGMTSAIAAEPIASVSIADDNLSPSAQARGNNQMSIQNTTDQNTNKRQNEADVLSNQDEQLDLALDALRLKKAVEQGIIDQSVLDGYNEQSLNDKTPIDSEQISNAQSNDNLNNSNLNNNNQNSDAPINDTLQQQAASIQQQGYQMMSPEEIERELAAVQAQNQDLNGTPNDNTNDNTNDNISVNLNDSNDGFDAPVATLDSTALPVGLDPSLDAATLPAPTNLDTLGRTQSDAETAEIMSRPIDVSDAVSSGTSAANTDIISQPDPTEALSQQERNPVTDEDAPLSEVTAQAQSGNIPDVIEDTSDAGINPEDYLPDYEAASETDAVAQSLEQADKPKKSARNKGNIVKRLYNRLFNGGVMALPHVDTTVYLQQTADNVPGATPKLIKADEDDQPINNIKAALDDTTVQSVEDFTAALPRLRETALNAAKAVGYYDVSLKLRQPSLDTIDVIIEKLGEPVRVESRIVDIRGEGIEQPEFKALEETAPPLEGDIFNHRVYKSSKAAIEALSSTYGYFDQYWLNKSVDIILPDNTADVSLVYNTGERYEFDDVVFFTYDEATGTLTRDPDKLPVELSLLRQLFDVEAGDPFYRPTITKFSNDLSATRYFNTVNVESILPPDERSEAATLAFDNTSAADGDNADADELNDALDSNINENGSQNDVSIGETASGTRNAALDNGVVDDGDIDSGDDVSANSGATVDEADIAPIEFEVDEPTREKLQAIKQKAERLTRLPNDRVLDEKSQKTDSFLGKISDSISTVVKKVFPDEAPLITDENFVPPTLEGRKTPEEVLESKKVPLYVFVSSNKPRDAQVGIGYGTDTGVRATGKIDYNLLNRQGYQAGAEVEVSRIKQNATVYASRPWKHPLNDKLEGRLTYEEEVIDQGEGNFDLSTRTLKAALARNIRKENGWDRSYFMRYRLDELSTGVDDTQLEDLPIRFTTSKPKQKALLFGYGMSKTETDNATNPTRGYRQYYGIEAGSDKVLSDTDMAIVHAGLSGLYSFGEDDKHQVLGRFTGGYIWADNFNEVPYKLRFFAGGDQSIRGYDYESLSPIDKGYLTGGQVLAVGSAEYNYEFRPGFRAAVFSDVGNAYDKDFETDTKVGVGVGIRWASPVGTVRVDVAAGVTEESIPVRLHFFIGSPL